MAIGQFSRQISAIDAILDDVVAAKGQSASLTDAIAAMQTSIDKKIPLSVGTAITDPDANNGVYADLFTLPVGKYHRVTDVSNTLNLPAGMTSAFYCEIVNTISSSRRKIYLYPTASTTFGAFYTCTELSSGYGAWYKFTGEVVSASAQSLQSPALLLGGGEERSDI